MTYSDKLKDPRWQKKRLEILNRDQFTCQGCGSTTTTLHVHHLLYHPEKEPWEINDIELITLCENCHTINHDYYDEGFDNLKIYAKMHGFTYHDLVEIAKFILECSSILPKIRHKKNEERNEYIKSICDIIK